MTTIFVPKERRAGEGRVAATPETVRRLAGLGLTVLVERGAGESAHFPDGAYTQAGAELVEGAAAWGRGDAIFKVAPPQLHEAEALREGALWIGLLAPEREGPSLQRLANAGVTALAMERVPRITRAQKMDALSSQASLAGYKAALLAACHLDKYFPLLMTAAGTVQPAKVVVMGAGVAGLQALATAKRLGAVVEVTDIRPAAKEQVLSLGGRFIDLPLAESGEGEGGYARELSAEALRKQQEVVADRVAAADVVITTALVPGKRAPTLLTAAMVERMRPGAIVVDLAVEQGGNCELSAADREVVHRGVRILGPSNLPGSTPRDASLLYARNVLEVFLHARGEDGRQALDLDDEIVGRMAVTHGGRLIQAPTPAPPAAVGPKETQAC